MWKSLSRLRFSRATRVGRYVLSVHQVPPCKTLPSVCSETPASFSTGVLVDTPHGSNVRFISHQSTVPSDLDVAEHMGAQEASENVLPSASSGEDSDVEAPADEIDPEQFENVISLLKVSVDSSFESTLNNMSFTLHEDFLLRVLEQSPAIPSGNLIRFFKWVSKSTDFKLTVPMFRGLVQAVLCNQEVAGLKKMDVYALWDLAREIGEKEKGTALDVGILNELIASLSRLGKGRAALEVFDKFDEFGFVPDSTSYYYTIEALCKRSYYDLAWPVCEKMIASRSLPDEEKKVGDIISWLCKGRMAKSAHSFYLAAKEKGIVPPPSAMSILIASLCKEDETVKLALEMLDLFKGEGRKYTIKVFSAVVHGLCRTGDLDGAKALLNEMISQGPLPGNAVFNMIINGYSKAREMEAAIEVKKLMQRQGLKPDLYTYSVIMSGYVSQGKMEEACKLLSEAKKRHAKLSPVMYHTLIRGFCKLEEFEKALGLFREMKDFGVKASVDEYSKLIQSLCLKALDWETAEELLEEMKESGLYLNGITRGLIKATKELETEALAAAETTLET